VGGSLLRCTSPFRYVFVLHHASIARDTYGLPREIATDNDKSTGPMASLHDCVRSALRRASLGQSRRTSCHLKRSGPLSGMRGWRMVWNPIKHRDAVQNHYLDNPSN